ncbi:hypothetical protein EMIHUDRAFT_244694 [Emiliania huxleyi CCMP1516]|uniref:Uncharacterized protein n=2 Tax=Emiliania huxleyi TaxID=2903 RepID=A0A0D3IZN4_EMIH1|nr:hypothetical protein EMIHUDRAFT_244694 [Emiliania huxleyi CCMP1516]EOD16719.1 hypothetical protein EMIHUDRAFT_244694 [Emiliania huxleyi CCMP1516]|eukprot:XP_005769148.1 hypothetical protein EMIHUDRAFT_244694 [Emiliania huxleyi CCMP1516]
MARVAMTGTAAADPVADGAGVRKRRPDTRTRYDTVVPPGMRSGRWNGSDRVQLEDAVMVARIAGAAERSYVERTAPKKKELTKEQLAARAAARKAKKARQKARRAKEAGERAASEAERAEAPRAQLRENIQYVMAGLRTAAAQTRSQAGSKIEVEYSLPPERDDGYRRGPSKVYAKVPQGTVATTVASDWLATELAEYGEIDAACRDRFVMHLMTAAGASAPADAVFRFTAGEAMQTSRPISASGEDDDEDTGSEEYSDDRASDR